jgi:hypothetical protein
MSYLKTQYAPWKIDLDFDGAAMHVRPRNDHVWHPLSDACHCIPTTDVAELTDCEGRPLHLPVYFHVALDGRTVPAPRPGIPHHAPGGPACP